MIPQLLGAVKRHSNRCAYLSLPCSVSYCELNSGRFWEVLACKLLKRMAPQVGLEPTTLRLTAGQCASCSLILKAFLAVQGRHNRCTWGVWLDKLLDNLSTSPIGPETQREWRICIGTNSAHRGKVGCTTPNFRSLWAPHLKYPCRWYERAGSRRSCSKYHQLVRAVRHPQSFDAIAHLRKGQLRS